MLNSREMAISTLRVLGVWLSDELSSSMSLWNLRRMIMITRSAPVEESNNA